MKKLTLLIVAIALSNCEIKPRSVGAEAYIMQSYQITYREINGMKYALLSPGDSPYGTGIVAINLTKDALEIELMKLQISKLKQ